MTHRPNRPKLVMTLLVRDEEDIIADNIWYHYHQGVDAFIIMDNLSRDRTPEIISQISKFIPIDYCMQTYDDYNQTQWVTAMARKAATLFDADWVINNDADEFWYSPRGRLIDIIEALPAHVGAVNVRRVNAVPTYKGSSPVGARANPRESALFDSRSTNSLGQPLPDKCFHRGSDSVVVAQGNHSVAGLSGETIDSDDFIIYHFPYQTYAHYHNKIQLGGQAYERNNGLPPTVGQTWRKGYEDLQAGRLLDFWNDIAYDESRAEFECLRGRLFRDISLTAAVQEADTTRAALIRKHAHRELYRKTASFVQGKASTLLSQLEAFSEAELPRRPLYRNLAFLLSGARRQKEHVVQSAVLPGYEIDFDAFRDMISLAPANEGMTEFAAASLLAAEPVSARLLQRDIQGRHVILHVSCDKFIDKARSSAASFLPITDRVADIIVIGEPDHERTESKPSWKFNYRDGILTVPTPDSYEMLHRKVLHAMFILSCLGPVSTVTKIDDSLTLSDGRVFMKTLADIEKSGASCAGRVVGSQRHDIQVHGWHIGKCSDPRIETRGYSYPLPRQYPAGGYGYILTLGGVNACAKMYLSMKEFLNLPAVGLEDACVGHAVYAADLEITDVSEESHLLALPGLVLVE